MWKLKEENIVAQCMMEETEVEVTVRQKMGIAVRWWFRTEYVVDICPDCFKNKLIPG